MYMHGMTNTALPSLCLHSFSQYFQQNWSRTDRWASWQTCLRKYGAQTDVHLPFIPSVWAPYFLRRLNKTPSTISHCSKGSSTSSGRQWRDAFFNTHAKKFPCTGVIRPSSLLSFFHHKRKEFWYMFLHGATIKHGRRNYEDMNFHFR